jgi:thiol-disulfide isomerase/thioredoxin
MDTWTQLFLSALAISIVMWCWQQGFSSPSEEDPGSSSEEEESYFKEVPEEEIRKEVQGESIGLEPKAKGRDEVPPSLKAQMNILGGVKGSTWNSEPQKGGQLIQDGTIVSPFNEIWNTGYQAVDLVFAGAKPLDNHSPADSLVAHPGEGINLTLYYAPWCSHCKSMMPAFNDFENKYNGQVINGKVLTITKVNSEEDPQRIKDDEINGFPQVKINGEFHTTFPRDNEKSMKEHVENL